MGAVKSDLTLLKDITKRYFVKRVLNELVPEEWIQAILDSNSSRKKGKCGEIKLGATLKKAGFKEVENWEEFEKIKKSFAEFSSVFSMKEIRSRLGIKIKTKKQGKKLDLIIKTGDRVFLVEAKHLNSSGGEQDKQISELIEILSLSEESKNISYLSFLDGSYSNVLLAENIKKAGKKLKNQRKDIKKYLAKNENNYWINTAGFEALIGDL
ncbi:MAG: DpnII family type II restriction endonuclease [Candidatus Portnoybacteria bacterium]|nr:DpnII family type II restriction endonuclease [Candidatus Portnoybacteria bacterium]